VMIDVVAPVPADKLWHTAEFVGGE
jgi:hypothetical protein